MTSFPVVASGTSRTRQVVADYVDLTKPKVQTLLLFTTVMTMEVAGDPSVSLVALTCLGGYLSAGGAGAINHYWDRDIDARMPRTANRPIPSGRVSPAAAVRFGILLQILSFVLLSLTVNVLAAALALGGFVGYVGVYTIWLKRRTPQNIVIGGAAGAVPVLVGWASVTGRIGAPAWVLFAIVFCWTPPHFWALSLKYRDDYAAAGIPMLPVVKGAKVAAQQIVVYSIVVVAITLALVAVGSMGWVYLVTAVALGVLFVGQAVRLERDATPQRAIKLFVFSNTYLALLFAAVAVDTLLHVRL
jgi:protoheme IX farnesyltransferase